MTSRRLRRCVEPTEQTGADSAPGAGPSSESPGPRRLRRPGHGLEDLGVLGLRRRPSFEGRAWRALAFQTAKSAERLPPAVSGLSRGPQGRASLALTERDSARRYGAWGSGRKRPERDESASAAAPASRPTTRAPSAGTPGGPTAVASHGDGWSAKAISRLPPGRHLHRVYRILRRWAEEGPEGLEDSTIPTAGRRA